MVLPTRPLNIAALVMALAIGCLAVMQWRASATFRADAVDIEARVVALRTAKKSLLDAEAEVFATVEFETFTGDIVRAELPSSVQALGLDAATLDGTTVPISWDPAAERTVRYRGRSGAPSAWALALLAVGALFVPWILRRNGLLRR